MVSQREKAKREFRQMMIAIIIIAVLVVVAALFWLSSQGELRVHMVIATILGVFFSVLVGTGLFALAFFSDKSGHDQQVTDATRGRDGN